jgi:hypothetical protein
VYLVEGESDPAYLAYTAEPQNAQLIHTFDRVDFFDAAPKLETNVTLNLTDCLTRNCTLFAHAKLTAPGLPPATTAYAFTSVRRIRANRKRNLFANATAGTELENSTVADRYLTYVAPALPVIYVPDRTVWQSSQIAGTGMQNHIRPVDDAIGGYAPILMVNDFWVLAKSWVALNNTTAEAHRIPVSVEPLTVVKFMLYVQFGHSMQLQSQSEWSTMSAADMDGMKTILLETDPWLLALTCAVTLLHLVFEYLTMTSDIQFWRGRKNFRGLSLRTVALSCYFQTIIFLYLFDGDETSKSVWIPSGIGVLIEYWKLYKTLNISRRTDLTEEQLQRLPFWRRWVVAMPASYDERTRTFDEQAMRYLFMAMAPCLLGYSIYSAIYDEHKGWYSFVIRTQVRFIYFAGFVLMTPQIFINYRLKTVAQLPWRVFVYKMLSTFIDDLFAFIITMPTLHRLAVFRDDLVFFVLLYQRWIYPVDATRTEDGDTIEASEQQAQIEGTSPQQQIAGPTVEARAPPAVEATVSEEKKKQ